MGVARRISGAELGYAIGREQGGDLAREAAAVVDQLPPEDARFPPTVVSLIEPKHEENADNRGQHADRSSREGIGLKHVRVPVDVRNSLLDPEDSEDHPPISRHELAKPPANACGALNDHELRRLIQGTGGASTGFEPPCYSATIRASASMVSGAEPSALLLTSTKTSKSFPRASWIKSTTSSRIFSSGATIRSNG